MNFSWDINIATLITIGVLIVSIITYMVMTNNRATSAHKLAALAHKRADDAHEKIGIQQSALAMFREHVAVEYIDRENLREMEKRLTDAINRIVDRLDDKPRK